MDTEFGLFTGSLKFYVFNRLLTGVGGGLKYLISFVDFFFIFYFLLFL